MLLWALTFYEDIHTTYSLRIPKSDIPEKLLANECNGRSARYQQGEGPAKDRIPTEYYP